MPFNPRLIEPDDQEPPPPEAAQWIESDELPPDLAELASQLSSDADRLSRCYPPREAVAPPPRRFARGRMVAAASVVLVAGLGTAAWIAWSGWGADARPIVAQHDPSAADELPLAQAKPAQVERALPRPLPPDGRREFTVQEVAATADDLQSQADSEPRDELSMLRAQLTAFEKVIVYLQSELERRQQRELELEAQVRQLTEQLQSKQ